MALGKDQRERLEKLADPVHVHRDLSRDGREPLIQAIWDAHQAGATTREISAATGVPRSTVHRWVLDESARRQLVVVADDGQADAR